MTPKHTPGPWRIKETRSQSGSPLKCIERAEPARGGINSLIAVLPDRTPSASQWGANTTLIAVAPELLELLDNLARPVDGSVSRLTFTERKLVDNLIAKAMGGGT